MEEYDGRSEFDEFDEIDEIDELGEFDEFAADADLPEFGEPAQLPRHPWFSMWIRPRSTVRAIIEANPAYGVIPLAAISGVIDILNRAAMRDLGDKVPFESILLGALVLGPAAGVVGLYIASWLLRLTGGWLGGQGDARSLRTAIAWGGVPGVWAGLLWVPQLLLIGEEMFTAATPRLEANPGLALFLLSTALLELVVMIWGFVVALKAVGEAHLFSAWRALGASVLAMLVVIVPVVLLLLAAVVMTM
jgi:hypothetical protein